MTPIFHHLTHPSLEYRLIVGKLRIRRVFVSQFPPIIIEVANNVGVAESVKSTFSSSTLITEVNERMSIFKSILFSLPVNDDDSILLQLAPASLIDETREIFTLASSTSEHARLIVDV